APNPKLQRRPKLQAPIHFCGECRERRSVRSNRRLITAGAWFVDLELGVSLKLGVRSLEFGSWGLDLGEHPARRTQRRTASRPTRSFVSERFNRVQVRRLVSRVGPENDADHRANQ